MQLHTDAAFKSAVQEVRTDCVVRADTLKIAEMMETLHRKPYRTGYPPHFPEGAPDEAFHQVRTAKPPLPDADTVAHFYDGYVLAFTPMRAIYLVQDGKKRPFPNMDTLAGMGYDLDMVLRFTTKSAEYHNIPDGPDLEPVAGRRRSLRGLRTHTATNRSDASYTTMLMRNV